MSSSGFKVTASQFLVDVLILDSIFVINCDQNTTVFNLGKKALEEYKQTYPVSEGDINPFLQFVKDARGRILSGSLIVKTCDYGNGLECVIDNNPSSNSNTSNTNDSNTTVSANAIYSALSSFESDQRRTLKQIYNHLMNVSNNSGSSSGGGSSVGSDSEPLPEAITLLQQLSGSTTLPLQQEIIECYNIIITTTIPHKHTYYFKPSLLLLGKCSCSVV